MNAAERLQEFLLDHSGGRSRADIELLLQGFHSVHPELAFTASARAKLRELLDLLELDGRIQLPKGKAGWDRSSLPPLPLWIRLPHQDVRASERVDLREIPWALSCGSLPTCGPPYPWSAFRNCKNSSPQEGAIGNPSRSKSAHSKSSEMRSDWMALSEARAYSRLNA